MKRPRQANSIHDDHNDDDDDDFSALMAISSASNPSKYSGGTTSTPSLTIKSLTTSDAGLYRCKADNNVGRGEGGNLEVQVNCEYSAIADLLA